MEGFLVFVAIVWLLACAAYTNMVAESKGIGHWHWAIAGLFFGPIALLAVGFMEAKKPKPVSTETPDLGD